MTTDELAQMIASSKDLLSPELQEMVNQISIGKKYKGIKHRDTQQEASTTRTEVCRSDTA